MSEVLAAPDGTVIELKQSFDYQEFLDELMDGEPDSIVHQEPDAWSIILATQGFEQTEEVLSELGSPLSLYVCDGSRGLTDEEATKIAKETSFGIAETKVVGNEPFFSLYDLPHQLTPEQYHRTNVTLNALCAQGLSNEQIRAGVALHLHFRSPQDPVAHENRRTFYDAYQRTLRAKAEGEKLEWYIEGIRKYIAQLQADPVLSDEEKRFYLKSINSAQFVLEDPLLFTDTVKEISFNDPENRVVDTSRIGNEGLSLNGALAAYSACFHQVLLPLRNYKQAEFERYVFHEIEHAISPQVRSWRAITSLRIGFQTHANSFRANRLITMHTRLNEGFNDFRARQRLGLDPMSENGSYPDLRQVVGRLVTLTGQEVWDDFYSPKSTFDKSHRQQSYRNLARAIGAVCGPGFLNRLDTTWALYGSEYVTDALDRKAYSEFKYVRPTQLRDEYQKLQDETEVLKINDLPEVATR